MKEVTNENYDLKKNIQTLRVISNECLFCGSKENLTRQHCIPRRHNPKRQVIIELCAKCHRICDAPYVQHTYFEKQALGRGIHHAKNLVKLLESLGRKQKTIVTANKN